MYTYVSIAVIIITTAALYLIFRKNDLKDYRYHIGLGVSAVIAIIASLFLPNMMSVFSVEWAMRFAVSFLIAFLIYITLIFLVMILVATLLPKKKMDKLFENLSEKSLARKNAKELKQKQKEEARLNSPKKAGEEMPFQVASSIREPVLKNIFVKKYGQHGEETAKPVEEASNEPDVTILTEPLEGDAGEASAEEITGIKVAMEALEQEAEDVSEEQRAEALEEQRVEIPEEKRVEVPEERMEKIADELGNEAPVAPIAEELIVFPEDAPGEIAAEVKEPEGAYIEESAEEALDEPLKEIPPEVSSPGFEETDIFDEASSSLAFLLKNTENTEKDVDTPKFIDKMESDMIFPDADVNEINLDQIIEKAFMLRQEGRDLEAASLYIDALDKKPNNELTFRIVIEICAVYKNAGQVDLAEDILLTYVDEFEDLMSDDIKEQILQNLYS